MNITDVLDINELHGLCESFTAVTGAVTAVLDLDGNVLVATGWQDICTRFHRVNADTCARCRESDTVLARQLQEGEPYNVYQCRNGLVDVAVPIEIGGEHVGNLFTGQFFMAPPDRQHFVRQARRFGFDEGAYLSAMERAPVFAEEHVRAIMRFFTRLAKAMGEMGLARLRLQQANARLAASAAIIDSSEDSIIGTGLDGIIESWNKGAERIFGYSASEMIGKPLAELIPPGRLDEEVEVIARISRGERVKHFETVRHDKCGRSINVSISISPIVDAAGKVVGASRIARDVTEAKRIERVMQHRQLMMERTESMARLASFEWDVGADVVTWSPEMYVLFGRDPAQGAPNLEGQAALYTEESTRRLFAAVSKAVADGTPYELELMTRQPDGELRPCLVKGFPERDERGRVVRLAGLLQDITERKRADEAIRRLAYHDSLTGLPNRRLLLDRIEQAMVASSRSRAYCALMFIDLDNFKPINDQHGHEAGDRLLVEAAGRLRRCVREMDTVARFGGDEFVVMISELGIDPRASTAAAEAIADKMREALSGPYRFTLECSRSGERAIEHRCTASVGVVLFSGHGATPDALLKSADSAMYRAKTSGKDKAVLAPAMPPP